MAHPIEPVLHPVAIHHLRPTQMTLGLAEVARKRTAWRARATRDGGDFLGRHMIPAVTGPRNSIWLIDHHHLVRALHEEGVGHVLVTFVAHLGHLPKKRFLAFMDSRNWLHPYDEHGRPHDNTDIPKHIEDLQDDPYRSLAGELRRAGGFAKSPVPYAEFLWADFLRDRIKRDKLAHDPEAALRKALALARDSRAAYLPGYAGPSDD